MDKQDVFVRDMDWLRARVLHWGSSEATHNLHPRLSEGAALMGTLS